MSWNIRGLHGCSTIVAKLYERLGLSAQQIDVNLQLRVLELDLLEKKESDYDAAWRAHGRAIGRMRVALTYFLDDNQVAAKDYAKQLLPAANEFFFGSWRRTAVTSEGKSDASWWKRRFVWMDVFEACLLWGSALGEWDFLRKLGSFPEADGCISQGWKAQDRDLDVAIGAFLRSAPASELDPLLDKAAAGSKKTCKCLVEVARACVARDKSGIESALANYLKTYRKADFPQTDLTKKISIFGTLFVHWTEAHKLKVQVPQDYTVHIVRL